jgi:hypothetical protein
VLFKGIHSSVEVSCFFTDVVIQEFQWVKARLFRTQLRGTRTRKRLNRCKALTFSRKLNPRYLGRMSTISQARPFEHEHRFTEYEHEYEYE